MRRSGRTLWCVSALGPLVLACAGTPAPSHYRLTASGSHWDASGADRVAEGLAALYPDYFAVILDPGKTHMPDLLRLRDDLERQPGDQRNYDALNAIAVGYFELNYRAEADRGGGYYLGDSTRAAKLAAVPWRAYGEISEPALRDAILDFYADVASGEKLHSARTGPRLARTVESLRRKENDPERLARIAAIAARLKALAEPAP